jgi:hypothetical protein
MDTTNLKKAGVGALAATGLLHLILAPEYLGEKAYVGVLFILGGLTCLGLAAWLWKRAEDTAGWVLAALTSAGMALGFILSRTVGLPGFHDPEWELSGVVSVLLEGGVVYAAYRLLRDRLPQGRLSVSG